MTAKFFAMCSSSLGSFDLCCTDCQGRWPRKVGSSPEQSAVCLFAGMGQTQSVSAQAMGKDKTLPVQNIASRSALRGNKVS